MTVARKLNVVLGLSRLNKPLNASEPHFVSEVQEVVRQLTSDLDYIFQQFEDVTPEIILEAMKPTFEKSQEYCPKDTGALVESGYLEVVSFRGKPKVEIGYAKGGNPRYAVYVHEMFQHHEPPTRRKWLEQAVNEDMFDIIDRVADGYKRFMGV